MTIGINFTFVFALLSVAVTISTPLCVICHHFCVLMSLFLRPFCMSELNLTERHYQHSFLARAMVLYVTKFEDITGRVLCYPFLNFGNTFIILSHSFCLLHITDKHFSLLKLTLLILCNFICCSQG